MKTMHVNVTAWANTANATSLCGNATLWFWGKPVADIEAILPAIVDSFGGYRLRPRPYGNGRDTGLLSKHQADCASLRYTFGAS